MLVNRGDLLFAWSGTPGTSFGAHLWMGQKAILNQHIFKIIFNELDIDKNYFKIAINSTLHELIGKAHGGVGLAHVTKGKFETTKLPLPLSPNNAASSPNWTA
ncbi:restriction endonuclease subunit S [Komagataeibacter rhaeticus]|nr:restriction endonuclease subunit S [Komagataeibacter rhaeticus]